MLRGYEHLAGVGVLDDFAHQHEDAFLAGAPRLGHVVDYGSDPSSSNTNRTVIDSLVLYPHLSFPQKNGNQ